MFVKVINDSLWFSLYFMRIRRRQGLIYVILLYSNTVRNTADIILLHTKLHRPKDQ